MYASIAKISNNGYTITVRLLMPANVGGFSYSYSVGGGGATHTGSGSSQGTAGSYTINGILYHEHLVDITFTFDRGNTIVFFDTNLGSTAINFNVPSSDSNGYIPVDPSTMPGYNETPGPTPTPTPTPTGSLESRQVAALERIAVALEGMNIQQGSTSNINRAMLINSLRRSGTLSQVVEELRSPTNVPGI